ncbi:MAG: plastocyanin/azurin family copper-binding protein [Gemmatimonadota bacterium]
MNQAGHTFEHTFENAGDFPYYCVPHQSAGMTGRIVVQ